MNISKKYKFSDFFEKNDQNQRNIDFLVFHHIEADSVEVAISLLKEHQVSSHYLIDEDGEVFLLVGDNDIAYHAGVSNFRGVEGLNKNSIGIELLNHDVNHNKFSKVQLDSLVQLSKELMEKYEIKQENIVGHSDIAYCPKENCLDRKDDPSHMFDWKYMAQNGVGIFPEAAFNGEDEILFEIGDQNDEIAKIKEKLANFGYRLKNIDGEFDIEMKNLCRVFNRRFNPEKSILNKGVWFKSSDFMLGQL